MLPVTEADKVEIRIQDVGAGVPEKQFSHLFESFYRGIVRGDNYTKLLPPVICINSVDFSSIPLDDFHTSFHIYEDKNVVFDRHSENKKAAWDERLTWDEEGGITMVGC